MMAAFVTVLLCSGIIGVQKVTTIGGISFGAGILFFPLSYVFGDVLAEVYGYARSRKVIWAGFAALIFASFMSWVIVALPPKPTWPYQAEYELIFGQTPRIVLFGRNMPVNRPMFYSAPDDLVIPSRGGSPYVRLEAAPDN
jgi:uncharacterized integral membrane protein (TIGR00697 family)